MLDELLKSFLALNKEDQQKFASEILQYADEQDIIDECSERGYFVSDR